MVGRERWEEIHRRAGAGESISRMGRQLALDRKTVRRCPRQAMWVPYHRPERSDTLLEPHAAHLHEWVPVVGYLNRTGFARGVIT